MSVLTAVLFILGVFFLFIGWRWQNQPDKELITALKAFSILKRQVNSLQDNYKSLKDKVTLNESILEEANLRTESLRQELSQNLYDEVELKKVFRNIAQEVYSETSSKAPVTGYREQQYTKNFYDAFNLTKDSVLNQKMDVNLSQGLSDKYQKVLELAQYGLSVPEISNRLMLSQDAVGMVLRTYGKGEWM